MRRNVAIGAVVAAVVVVVVLVVSGGGSGGDGYVVRAIFDNGGFMVKGEQVRVAGANVGEIESVGVTLPGEVDSYEGGEEQKIAGKAVIVMKITDPGFQDFRSDASCLIRPQSLIGEKFVDCRPTIPRAPGSPQAPALKKVPSGQPGAGQYLLPLENNSTSVDPDLINDINKLPYAQRFRLIFNELGAGLAGRGADIEAAVKRANPVLRDVTRLIGKLNSQRDRLVQLASDSEKILGPLSRERAHVAGFFTNAGAAAQASSERGADLEASLRKFPAFLREFRLTMRSLQGFSDAATPVFTDLGKAAPSFTEATRQLAPFSAASTVSLKSLGATRRNRRPDPARRRPGRDQDARPRPVRRQPDDEAGEVPRQRQGNGRAGTAWSSLIYNGTASTNGFDKYGHFLRTLVTLTNCPNTKSGNPAAARLSSPGPMRVPRQSPGRISPGFSKKNGRREGGGALARPAAPSAAVAPSTASPPSASSPALGEGRRLGARAATPAPRRRALLDYLLGP